MSAHRYQSSYNGITFNRLYSVAGEALYGPDDERRIDQTYAQSDYRLESLDLTRVTVEEFRELRQFLEGAEANESFEGVLYGIGRGVIHGSSYADLEDKTWALRAAFSPALVRIAANATDPLYVLPWDFKVDSAGGASARRLYCRPAIGRPVVVGQMRQGLSRRFMVQVMSMDPKVYSQTLHSTVVALGGGNVNNAGNFYSYPKIKVLFSGAGSAAFTMTCTTTGRNFNFDASSAAAGETWVVDPKLSHLTRLSDGANRYTKRTGGYLSQLFLPPGQSTWAFTNTGGITSITFDFRDAWA